MKLISTFRTYDDMFEDTDQHDAHEFIISLLNFLDFERTDNYSVSEEVFGGVLCNSII